MRILIPIILGGALAAACGKGDDKKAEDSPKKVEQTQDKILTPEATDAGAAAGETDQAPEVAGAQEVPAQEDFEEKAATEVNPKNLEDEVKKIEKEIVPE